MKLSFLAILAMALLVASVVIGVWISGQWLLALVLGICGVGVAVLSLRDSE